MADGSRVDSGSGVEEATSPSGDAGLMSWLRTRRGKLAIWFFLAVIAFAAVSAWHFLGNNRQATFFERAIFIAATPLVWLPLVLLALDPKDNMSKGPGPWLPFISLSLLVLLTGLVVADNVLNIDILATATGEGGTSGVLAARAAFFSLLVAVFIPCIWNAANFARHDAARRAEIAKAAKLEESVTAAHDNDAESIGALLATIVVIVVGGLAYLAGSANQTLSIQNSWGLILCFSMIGIFLIVVFLDAISESPPVQALSRGLRFMARRMHWLASFYDWVDTGLVRIGAFVAGTSHARIVTRYAILGIALACLGVMGWFLPAPLGFVPAFIGFVLALSVSRIWSWVEDDRALAAMTEFRETAQYRVGFREDFRDETLLGFVFVFVLIPVGMMQAQTGDLFGDAMFQNADSKQFIDWLAFFGVELAKAVPIVDWAEIYGVKANEEMIAMDGVASRHAVFMARVMVDMVLIASLLQAIGIATRNRQQKRLYNSGQINRLDPFVERTELKRAIRAARRPSTGPIRNDLTGEDASKHFRLARLKEERLIDFRTYDESQLRRIYVKKGSDIETRAFIATIAHERGFPLGHAIEQVIEIAESHRNEVELFGAFLRAEREHDDAVHNMEIGDLYRVLTALRAHSGLRDFKERVIKTMPKVGVGLEVCELLRGLASGDRADKFQYARNDAVRAIGSVAAGSDDCLVVKQVHDIMLDIGSKQPRPSDGAYNAALSRVVAKLGELGCL